MKERCKRLIPLAIVAFVFYLAVRYLPFAEGALSVFFAACAPLFVGAIIAYVVNIPMMFYERHLFGNAKNKVFRALKRPVCMLLAIASIIGAAFLISTLIVPRLVSAVELLIQKLPPFFAGLYNELDEQYGIGEFVTGSLQSRFGEISDWRDLVEKGINLVIGGFGGVMNSVFTLFGAVFSFVFSLIFSVAFAIYLLAGKERIAEGLRSILDVYAPKKVFHGFYRLTGVLDDSFHGFLVGQCTEAVILGMLVFIGMSILQFPQPSMIGALVGFTALIPIAGAYIGASVGAFLVLSESNVITALLFIVFLCVLQQFEGNLIYPRVVGASIGLPAIWVLAAITIGGSVAGIPGMLVGVPLAASLFRLVRENVEKRKAEREEREKEEQVQENAEE